MQRKLGIEHYCDPTVTSRADVKILGVLALRHFSYFSKNLLKLTLARYASFYSVPDGESTHLPVNLNELIVCESL